VNRVSLRSGWILAALVAFIVASPSPATAATTDGCNVGPITNFLAADTTQEGVITLHFFGARGARVEFFECVNGRRRPLGALASAPGTATILRDATTWFCSRPARRFVARATLPDGSRAAGAYDVRTGSCASRFELSVPRRVAPGRLARVRIVDRWAIGAITPRLCITPPGERRTCRKTRLARAVTVVTRRFRARTRGGWRVELQVRSHRIRRSVAVGAVTTTPKAPESVLTTGDSTMQGIDGFLGDELGDTAIVHSDVRPGSAISKADWPRIAAAQVRRRRPTAAVVSLGVNDGFPMKTPAGTTRECCGVPWLAEYARRVRHIMRIYRRSGRGRVVWLTLPLPRAGRHTAVITAVNAAIVRAGRDMTGVTVLRMDRLFSPNGFTETIRYRGRDVRIRTADGIHLNVSGTAIAAKVIAAALRKP